MLCWPGLHHVLIPETSAPHKWNRIRWEKRSFPEGKSGINRKKMILGKRTLTVYHTWRDCSEKCLLVWSSHGSKPLHPGRWEHALSCVRDHSPLPVHTFVFSWVQAQRKVIHILQSPSVLQVRLYFKMGKEALCSTNLFRKSYVLLSKFWG